MKKLMLGMLLLSLAVPQVASASAVLLDASGGVAVKLPDASAPKVQAGMELPDGSLLSVASGGRASVLLQSGELHEVAGGEAFTVGAPAAKAKGTELGKGIAVAMGELSGSGAGPTVHGMVKEAGGPKQGLQQFTFGASSALRGLYPVATAIRPAGSLTFRTSQPIPAEWKAPVLIVDDAAGRRLMTKGVLSGKLDFTVTSGELKLSPGQKYSWYLGVLQAGKAAGKTSRFEFTVLSAADEKALAAELARVGKLDVGTAGRAILTAQLLQSYRLYEEMVRTLAPLSAGSETPSFVKRMLFFGYTQMGDGKEAAKYR